MEEILEIIEAFAIIFAFGAILSLIVDFIENRGKK